MKATQLILVPTDFSDFSGEAMRRAIRLSQWLQAQLHALHVLDDAAVYYSGGMDGMPVPMSEDVSRSLEDMARERMQNWLAQWPDVTVTSHIVHSAGDVPKTICHEAEALSSQLIVIGKHGHQSFLERMLIGSTTEHVVRHAHCSVLVAMPTGILADHTH